jgi:hypothetical protein
MPILMPTQRTKRRAHACLRRHMLSCRKIRRNRRELHTPQRRPNAARRSPGINKKGHIEHLLSARMHRAPHVSVGLFVFGTLNVSRYNGAAPLPAAMVRQGTRGKFCRPGTPTARRSPTSILMMSPAGDQQPIGSHEKMPDPSRRNIVKRPSLLHQLSEITQAELPGRISGAPTGRQPIPRHPATRPKSLS